MAGYGQPSWDLGVVYSGLQAQQGSADMLQLPAGSKLRDLALIQGVGGTPTSGAGVHFTAGPGSSSLTRVVVSGSYWKLTDSFVLDPVNYGLLIDCLQGSGDWGDGRIAGTQFMVRAKNYTPAAAIRYEGGGGLSIVGLKIVSGFIAGQRFVRGIDLAVKDGIFTGDFYVGGGSSIEGCTGAQINIGQKGTTGFFTKAQIVGVEFLGVGGASVGVNIAASSGIAANNIIQVMVDDCVFDGLNIGIAAQSMYDLKIGSGNQFLATQGGAATVTTPISIGNAVTGYDVAQQSYGQADGMDLILDAHNDTATPGQRIGVIDYTDSRDIHTTAQSIYEKLWQYDIAAGGGTTALLEIDGVATNGTLYQPFVIRQERAVTRTSDGTTLAASTIGTDFTMGAYGATVTVQFAGLTSVGITVQVAGSDAAYFILYGTAKLTVRGNVTRFHRGA
jgi:hypothetical protein